MKTRIAAALIATVLASGWASAIGAEASPFPSKPITLIVPFSSGSGTDQIARGMAQVVASAFNGAAVVVENRPGASGMIAAQAVVKAPPDGHTLFIATNTTQSANPHLFKKLSYDPVADFTPIAAIARGSMVLVVPASSPIKSVADFIAAGKKKSLSFGAGNSSSRVATEMFSQMTGIQTLYAPYKGNPQAVTDLVGGQLDFMFGDMATTLPLIQSGRLRALGYAGDKRTPALPNLPTISEQGVKGYELFYWVAVYGPRGMAPDLVKRLNEVFVKATQSEGIVNVYSHAVLDAFTTTPEGLAQFQRSETDKWGRVIRQAGIEPE